MDIKAKNELSYLMDLSEDFVFANDELIDIKSNEPYKTKCLKKTKLFNLYREQEGDPKQDPLYYYLADKENGDVYEKYYDPEIDYDSDSSVNLFMADIKEFLSKFGYGPLKLIGKVRVHGFEYERGEGEFRPVYLNEYNQEKLILAEAEYEIRRYTNNEKGKGLIFCHFDGWKTTSPEYPIRKVYIGEPIFIENISGYEPYTSEALDKLEEIDPPIKRVRVRDFDPICDDETDDEGCNVWCWVKESEVAEHKELFEKFAKICGLEIVSLTYHSITYKVPNRDKTNMWNYHKVKRYMEEKELEKK